VQSSLNAKVPEYVGADLTDRYSGDCRDVDVCGLTPDESGGLRALFWRWHWDPAPKPLDVAVVASELAAARVSMVDGPQALAINGNTLRLCERQSAAVGKTPDARPALSKPFAGFICSSLDLFNALHRGGTRISPLGFVGGVSEVYPGHIWAILGNRRVLPRKSTQAGRAVRMRILEALGVIGLPELPTHDQNDACVAALIAAAADGRVPGVSVASIGSALLVDIEGTLREGPMVIPQVTAATADAISRVLHDTPTLDGLVPAVALPASDPPNTTGDDLLSRLIAKAVEGDPQVCTYARAYRVLFNRSYSKWSQEYANRVIELARRTTLRELSGLGFVRLDAFIVSKKDGRPSDGYWPLAQHDREDWERALGCATVLD
jgi:hypothetical protein